MGRAKNAQIEHQGKVQQAIRLCIEIGAIQECELHEGEYIDSLEYLDPDELTTTILAEIPDALDSFANKNELAECVREAMESAGEECGYCAKNRDS